MAETGRSEIRDIDRSLYDFRYESDPDFQVESGLTPEIVETISREKTTRTGCGRFA